MSGRILAILSMFVIFAGAAGLADQQGEVTKHDTPEQARAQVSEPDTPEEARVFAEGLMADFREAVRKQSEVKTLSEDDRQAALEHNSLVSRKIVDSLSEAVTTHNHARVQALVTAMRAEGIYVKVIEGRAFVVRFPREFWAGRKKSSTSP
jgi:hypothetical protein